MNETIADIIAEMRRREKNHYYPKVARNIMHQYADRIEAAWKREREELERYAASKMLDGATILDNRKVGNAAAMREALEAVIKVGYPHNFQHEAYHIRTYCEEITEAIRMCRKVLSAPARNCDRFNHKDPVLAKNGAVQHWQNETDCAVDFGQWLLAPAAERKGERDA